MKKVTVKRPSRKRWKKKRNKVGRKRGGGGRRRGRRSDHQGRDGRRVKEKRRKRYLLTVKRPLRKRWKRKNKVYLP